jgi:hypothetical protein
MGDKPLTSRLETKVMTVKELIKFLGKQPQEAIILFRAYSTWNAMELDEIQVSQPSDKGGIILHNGVYMEIPNEWWPKRDGKLPEKPNYLTCLLFPGN